MTYKKFKICYVLVYTLHVEEHLRNAGKSQVDLKKNSSKTTFHKFKHSV